MATYNVNRETGELIPVSGGTLYADTPVGTILPYGGTVAPAGWLICDGSALKRSTYAELFSVIGTQFGVGDGSTTFNLPDMREAVPKGAGLTGKSVGNHVSTNGLSVGEFIDDRIQNITGQFSVNGGRFDGADKPLATYPFGAFGTYTQPSDVLNRVASGTGGVVTFDASRVARTGVTTEVKSVGVSYIIKAQRVAVPADFMASIHEAISQVANLKWYNQNTSRAVTNGTTEQTAISINIPPSSSPRAFIITSHMGWNVGEPIENQIYIDSSFSGGHEFTIDQTGIAGRLSTVTVVGHLEGDNAAHVISNKVKYLVDNAMISSRLKVIEITLPELA